MFSIRADIEVLREKAAECEHAAKFAIEDDSRAIHRKRAKLYRELIDEAELTLRRSRFDQWHAGK
jgi:hypothetical protein